ncbi:MAG TPA: hypothetical protein VL860_15585 [Planctomycetota bacterium]|nr:hypothetical protein [Planctomycetota bacterium]
MAAFVPPGGAWRQYLSERMAAMGRVSAYAHQTMRRNTSEKIDHMETELAILTIANRAMFELLIEKGLATQIEIEAKMKQLADRMEKGELDDSPEALASVLQIKVDEDEDKEKMERNLDRMARARALRNKRRKEE